MRINKTICDVCGNEVKPKRQYSAVMPGQVSLDIDDDFKMYELCYPCCKVVYDFMEKIKKKHE